MRFVPFLVFFGCFIAVSSIPAEVAIAPSSGLKTKQPPGYTIPIVDLSGDAQRQVVVDREAGQYLGHPTTVLLEDGKTMLIVYPKGHGKGAIIYKRSTDGGLTWSERLPTPKSWETSKEVPTMYRTVDAAGKKRLIMFSGLYPVRMAVSEDDGATWSELKPIGDFGGIVAMASCIPLKAPGHYMALFHDDGRFFHAPVPGQPKPTARFIVYKTVSTDGGLTWSAPVPIAEKADAALCEPGALRSPDGKQIAVLLRENSRKYNSFVIFSDDEGETWTEPRELPASLTGDRHTAKYVLRTWLFISFRDTTHLSPTKGDWVGWMGRYEDIVNGTEGGYRVRLMHNTKGADCAYPAVEILDGQDPTVVATTYGHWTQGEMPYIMSVRFSLWDVESLAQEKYLLKGAENFPKPLPQWQLKESPDLSEASHAKVDWIVVPENGEAVAARDQYGNRELMRIREERPSFSMRVEHPLWGNEIGHFPFPCTVLKVEDGWLAGYNVGEFGGALWWFSEDGKSKDKISDDQITQFVRMGDRLFATEGLTHMNTSRGSVIEIKRKDGKWMADTFVEMPSTPYAVARADDKTLCVASNDTLYSVSLDKKIERLTPAVDWTGLFPTSVVVQSDGKIFIGMRQFVGLFDLHDRGKGMKFLVPDESFLKAEDGNNRPSEGLLPRNEAK